MEVIEKMLDSDETILWSKVRAPRKRRERVYVITNKRIYYKSHRNRKRFFSDGLRDIIRMVDDIVIMERLGVSVTRSSRRQSGMVSMVPYSTSYYILNIYNRFGWTSSPYLTFSGLNEDTTNDILMILRNYNTIPDDYRISYKKRLLDSNLISDPNIKIEACHYDPNVITPPPLSQNLQLQTPQTNISSKQPSNTSSQVPWYMRSGPEPVPPPMQTHVPPQGPPQSNPPQHMPYPQYSQQPSQPLSQPSMQVQPEQKYISPSFKQSEVIKNTAQILKATDENIYHGFSCKYCDNDLATYQEEIYSCGNCGAFYHKNCLNNLMREGVCLSCNKILLW